VFYRRKIILALLQLLDGQLEKIRLQKLLFLFTEKQSDAVYDFIPFRFGCYSYSANADMTAMVSKGILAEDETYFEKTDPADYFKQLKPDDLKLLLELKDTFGKMSSKALMRYTYLNYPFYALKSEAIEKVLSKEESDIVNAVRPVNNKTVLYTIGYEGISLEEYLNRLLINDIKVLVDVRNNPLSMKYGFTKSQLSRYCLSLGIRYVHIPDLGIQSHFRQDLNTQADYDRLFADYRENTLKKTIQQQLHVLRILNQCKRVALTCFEANIDHCHRKHLAEAIEKLPNFEYEVKHI
jgi:uncharacterized protein (DUF488 family)